jgi:hypothetical protein
MTQTIGGGRSEGGRPRRLIRITREAHEALVAQSLSDGRVPEFANRPELPGGGFALDLDPDVYERLKQTRRVGESYSATLIRLVHGEEER